jgi:hypothetical protein
MKLFLLTQCWIFQRTLPRGQRAAVGAMDESMGMQDFQILSDRNLRGFELAGEFCDQHSPVMVEHIENSPSTFFV